MRSFPECMNDNQNGGDMKKIRTNKALSLLCIAVGLFFIPLLSYAKTAREIAQSSFPSVVMLVTEDNNGQMLSLGSGFVVKSGIVATNLHVIKDATRGYAKLIGQCKI